MASTFDDVADVISNTLPNVDKDSLSMDTTFQGDLNADSLDLVELIMELEEHYDLSIPDEDAQEIASIGDAVRYIEEHQ
ncbi:MAG: acyl carrier protein [Chloroflexi bacterium]|nr:acyl carrier protein [Chloroflexota bacterium]MDE2701923.1 acyl carrier protein [Chloroflexota bacterium]MDE2935234.1 acyl carrier protein [Chloroflexota bacterium]MXW27759.1 acyl carrier protein [Chloroflexota bacterium]MXX67125.1 acyl carrier protein [Chloroflexota bacterium]